MMHGRGESDSATVAGKPTNKAERSAALMVKLYIGSKSPSGNIKLDYRVFAA
jgi:hypothetical protein